MPVALSALDGRRHVGGVVVQTWVAGTPPRDSDWPAVAATLRTVHTLTARWPQRPGFTSTHELLTVGPRRRRRLRTVTQIVTGMLLIPVIVTR